MSKLATGILAVSLVAGLTGSAMAATATANLQVTATVSATCTVATDTLSFGAYDPSSGTDNDAQGAVKVTCTNGTTYSIALDAGANPSASDDVNTRRMLAGASNYLPYQIYIEAGRTNVWGDGANGSKVNPITAGTFIGNGNEISHTAYGRILAGQYVAPGSYADTVVVTVTYP